MASTFPSITASTAVSALERAGVDHVVTVPDWVQLSLHSHLQKASSIRVLNACNENQCVTTAAGLTIAGRKPLLVMQNQGLYNCINTLRAVCMDAQIPLVFLVGQFGREFSNIGQDPKQSRRTMVRIMEPVLDALEIPWNCLDSDADVDRIEKAYEIAHQQRTASVVLVGAPMSWR
ncbi:thiamine pyrophosphate-binding protein [Comamonas testosteroni]|uniref:Thiamine pyrophosphate-binding protein n=1 Tax=Comamonas testosteroni TaxID=285 RepID=A0A0L7MKZ8_COMTE|nr:MULTISPECIES: thiamine pyrophosphate-binding protein [Comamonas]KOC22550.1 thiamine pyrophosphate-binding protein [Comamonas testosteroni]